jgi:hypothetical protein
MVDYCRCLVRNIDALSCELTVFRTRTMAVLNFLEINGAINEYL